jgi:hypothetical protein
VDSVLEQDKWILVSSLFAVLIGSVFLFIYSFTRKNDEDLVSEEKKTEKKEDKKKEEKLIPDDVDDNNDTKNKE